MKRRGVLRRSAVAGVALVTATTMLCAATGGAVMADPSTPRRGEAPGASVGGVVKDLYIVVLKDGKASAGATRAAASSLTAANGGSVRKVFSSAVRGFSAQLNEAQAKRLATRAEVSYVEPVRKYSASATQTNPPSWGLDRVDQTGPVQSLSYTYPTTASNVTAYIIDTGINIAHQDFGGRASYGYDFVGNDTVADDCNGHGTHVAGTVGGTTFGVAKGVKLVGVRVLDCDGSGTTEGVVAGIDWVTAHAVKPAVANMSLGSPVVDQVLDNALKASIASGVTYAVAAGNEYQNACQTSPGNVPTAITVGATDNVDFRAWFSNYGPCLDVFAPGVNITSAAIGGTTGSASMDGTSMASPHVAGAAALLLSAHPAWTPQQVRDAIVTGGTSGAVQDAMGSPNRLLRVGTSEVARSSVGLRARVNGKYVTAAGGLPLIASGTSVTASEQFDQVDAGGGLVALRSKANGKYVSADAAGAKPLVAKGSAIAAWEKFQVVNNVDGSVSFKASVNGKFVTADGAGAKPLIASRTSVGLWEKFEYVAPATTITIKAKVNGKFVTADGAGAKPLIASRLSVGLWEKFEILDAGNGYMALKAKVNGKYVMADGAGSMPLIAKGSGIGAWEKFLLWNYLPDGSVNLVADINLKAVTADGAGTKPLIANQDGLGLSEEFFLAAI
jgi:subtilisin family serine protease